MPSKHEYFLKISEERSISKAAQELLLSQPYLSQYLNRLEKSLGVTLFNRSCIPLELTPAGKAYLDYVQKCIALDNQLTGELEFLKKQEDSQLTIGVSGWRASFMLPKILSDFYRLHPRTKISVREGHSPNLRASFLNGLIDVCLLNTLEPSDNDRILCEERILLAVPADNMSIPDEYKKAGGLPGIDLALFANSPFILVRPGSLINTLVKNAFDKLEVRPPVFLTTESVTTALNMASEGLGLAFVPELGLSYELSNKRSKLLLFYVREPVVKWYFVAQVNKMYDKSALVDDFVDVVYAYCKQYLLRG